MMLTDLPEPKSSLTSLVIAPLVWAAHFGLAYGTAAIWCAKVAGPAGSFTGAQVAIALYTVVALAATGYIGWRAWRTQRVGHLEVPDDRDSANARHRFIALATLLLAGLSAIAIIYAALAAALVGICR